MHTKMRGKGAFTLVEIMIVVAIIGLLVALAVPNFVRMRRSARENLCMNNMRLTGHAGEQYLIDENLDDAGDIAAITDLEGYIKGGVPECPEEAADDDDDYAIAAGTDGGLLVTCNVNEEHGEYDTGAPSGTLE